MAFFIDDVTVHHYQGRLFALAGQLTPDDLNFVYVDKDGVLCSATVDAGEIIVAAADAYAFVPGIQVEGGTADT